MAKYAVSINQSVDNNDIGNNSNKQTNIINKKEIRNRAGGFLKKN